MVGAPVKQTGPPTPPPQKPRPVTPQREANSTGKRGGRPGPIIRIAVSVLIVWHFAGVFLAALQVPATSQLVTNVSQKPPMQWYLDALYLNQAHSFFAPDVGPGHVIQYELYDQRGQVIERGSLPNRKEHWPRLYYHRHLMLADQAEVPSDDKQLRDYWQRMYLEAYARHLLRVNNGAQGARVQRYAHWPLPREYAVLDRRKGYDMLRQDFARQGENRRIDEQGYELLAEAIQRRTDLVPDPANQTLNWQSDRTNVASRWTGGPR